MRLSWVTGSIGGAVVVVATAIGWNHTEDRGALLVLGGTGIVVAVYTWATLRMAESTKALADETRDMAKATSRMATAAVYPNILLIFGNSAATLFGTDMNLQQGKNYFLNMGPGPARDVSYTAGEGEGGWRLAYRILPPQIPMPVPDACIHMRRTAEPVMVTWRDFGGNDYRAEWRFDHNQWVCGVTGQKGLVN